MTKEEKIAMYKEKKGFVKALSKVFENYRPDGAAVQSLDYKVFTKPIRDQDYFAEWIIVTFVGGARSPISVNGNSNTANFRAIGKLLDGGYYDGEPVYERQLENGYKEVEI